MGQSSSTNNTDVARLSIDKLQLGLVSIGGISTSEFSTPEKAAALVMRSSASSEGTTPRFLDFEARVGSDTGLVLESSARGAPVTEPTLVEAPHDSRACCSKEKYCISCFAV